MSLSNEALATFSSTQSKLKKKYIYILLKNKPFGQLSKTCWQISAAEVDGVNWNSQVRPLTNINFKFI